MISTLEKGTEHLGVDESALLNFKATLRGVVITKEDPSYDDEKADLVKGEAHKKKNQDTAFSYRDVDWEQVIVGVDPDPANGDTINLDKGILDCPPSVLGGWRICKFYGGRRARKSEGCLPR